MNATRRAFLGTAAAVPLAVAIPTSALAEAPAAAPIIPPSPYRDYPWRWWVSMDGEIYRENFATEAEAIAYAKQCEYPIVAECQQQDFDLSIDGDSVLEMLYGQNEEKMNEDGDFIEVSGEVLTDLGVMVTAAIEAWAVKHKVDVAAWMFGNTRNQTKLGA